MDQKKTTIKIKIDYLKVEDLNGYFGYFWRVLRIKKKIS